MQIQKNMKMMGIEIKVQATKVFCCSLLVSCMAIFIFQIIFANNSLAQDLYWSKQESMPIPRIEFGAATVNDKIYLFGGYSGSVLTRVDEYNSTTGVWTKKSDMPTPRRILAGAAVNGKIYAIGGWNFTGMTESCSGTFFYATEEYDPQTDSWTKKADFPMPPPVNSCVGNTYIGSSGANGKIYVFIFNTNIDGTSATYEFDPISNVWDTNKSPVPFSYTRYATANWNGKIYVLGTKNGGNGMQACQFAEYDPVNDLWTMLPSTSTVKEHMQLAANSAGLYSIGGKKGYSADTTVSTVEYYNPETNNGWQSTSNMSTPRYSSGAVTVNDSIYVLGGGGKYGEVLSSVEKWSVKSIISANSGIDQIVFDKITLDGSGSSNPENDTLTYSWQAKHRTNSTYDQTATGISPTLSNLQHGFYDVTLKITNSKGLSATDTMMFAATGPVESVTVPENIFLPAVAGWNLLGLKQTEPVNVADLPQIINWDGAIASVWKWGGKKWAVHLSGKDTVTFAAAKGFDVLETIYPGEGFWVNASL